MDAADVHLATKVDDILSFWCGLGKYFFLSYHDTFQLQRSQMVHSSNTFLFDIALHQKEVVLLMYFMKQSCIYLQVSV